MGAADSHIFLSLNGIPKIPLFIFSFNKLSLLRKILIKFFPDDFIFIINKKEISKKDEEIDLLEQGDKKALKKLLELAWLGNSYAQYKLGNIYKRKGVLQNYNEAVKWYRLSAEQENADAQYKLGIMFFCGWGRGREPSGPRSGLWSRSPCSFQRNSLARLWPSLPFPGLWSPWPGSTQPRWIR